MTERDSAYYDSILEDAESLAEDMAEMMPSYRPKKSLRLGATATQNAGMGGLPFEFEDFDPDRHEIKDIHARRSAMAGRDIVLVREDETPIRNILWRATSPGMNWVSLEKQKAADTLLLATARTLVRKTLTNEFQLLNDGRVYTSKNQVEQLTEDLANTEAPSQFGTLSEYQERLKERARLIMFSDCIPVMASGQSVDDLVKGDAVDQVLQPILEDLKVFADMSIRGHLVHVYDVNEWQFPFSGEVEFLEHSGMKFRKNHVQGIRDAYLSMTALMREKLEKELDAIEWQYSIYVAGQQPLIDGLKPLFDVAVDLPLIKPTKQIAKENNPGLLGNIKNFASRFRRRDPAPA